MKTLLSLLFFTLIAGCISAQQGDQGTSPERGNNIKYICSRDNMADSVFTDVYESESDCRKYCTGIGTVCEPTGKRTPVDTQDVAD